MRRRPGWVAALAVGIALLSETTGMLAQSPIPSPRASPTTVAPTAAPRPDPCAALASLPDSFDGRALVVTVSAGVSAIDPDDLIDPLLAGLGRTRDDVCVATLQTGSGTGGITGQLLRIAGADAGDLAERLAATLSDRLAGAGAQASASPTDLAGTTAWTLDVVAEGQPSRVVIAQFGDTLLITSDPAAMRSLAPLLTPVAPVAPASPMAPASPVTPAS